MGEQFSNNLSLSLNCSSNSGQNLRAYRIGPIDTSAETTQSLERVMKVLGKAKWTLIALMVIGSLLPVFASSAYADSSGRCGGHVTTGKELYEEWRGEGVTSQAAQVVKSAGYHAEDDDLKSWMHERVVKAKLAKSVTLVDYGCHPGELFGVGTRDFAKGVTVMIALPKKLSKSDLCSAKYRKKLKRLRKHKKYKRLKRLKGCKRIVVTAGAVGKVNCSNPLAGKVKVVLIVKKHKKRKQRHHRPRHKQPPSGSCNGNNVNNGNGSAGNCNANICVGQNNCNVVVPPPVCTTCEPPPPPPPPPPNCKEKPDQKKCKPTIEIETINDMLASRDGHHYKRYICWDVYPGAESSLGSIETRLYIHYSVKLGGVEYRGGNEFCQFVESSSEPVLEEYHAWARDTNTQAFGESAYETFPIKNPPSY